MNASSSRHWSEVTFGEIVGDSAFGPRFSGDAYAEDGNISTLRTTDISEDGRISYENMPRAQLDEAKFAKHFLRGGDLVITRSGRVGTTAIFDGYPEPVLPGAFLIRFRLRENADPRFFRYWFNSRIGQQSLLSVACGVAQQNINITNVKRLKVPLPAIAVQRDIASILSAYDDLIENNRWRIQLLEQAARLLYREWFVYFRFPGHEHVKINDGVPEGWEKKTLGGIIEIKKGKNITKETASEGKVPVVAGGLTPAYFHNTPNATGPVITISASGANAGYVNIYHEDIWASDCSYISNESTEHIYYYYTLLKSKQKEIFGFQKGAAQPHVYPKDLMRLSVVSPPDRMLGYFIDTISHTFTLTKNLITQNKSLTQARDILLPRLMNGEVAV